MGPQAFAHPGPVGFVVDAAERTHDRPVRPEDEIHTVHRLCFDVHGGGRRLDIDKALVVMEDRRVEKDELA